MKTALFDVGGTNTRFAVADGGELDIVAKVETKTDAHPLEFLQNLILEHPASGQFSAAVVALPGEIDGTTLTDANNLPEWNGADFNELVDGEVTVVNDADAAALGEAHFGAGQNLDRFGYVTVSTGVGGGLVARGELGGQQFGFEVGEQIIDWENGDSLEVLVGGVAVEARTGKLTGQINDKQVLKPIVKQLAAGLFNTAVLWSTTNLVVNGPSFFESDLLWPELETEFKSVISNSKLEQNINLHLAQCGDNAGLYGCLHLANTS